MAKKVAGGAGTSPRKAIAPVQLFVGDQAVLVREAWQSLVQRVFGGDPPPMSISEYDGATTKLADVLDDVRTPSFLSPTKLVRVRDAESLIKGDASRDIINRFCEKPAAAGVLVLQVKQEPATTRLHKLVSALGGVVDCSVPKRGFDAVAWCVNRCDTHLSKGLDLDAAETLADLIGPDLTHLANELDKLAIFVGDAPQITLADVTALVGPSRVEAVFAIADLVVQGQPGEALGFWRRLIENDRDAPFKAVGGFAFKFRQFLAARRLMDTGLSEFEIIQQTGAFALKGRLAAMLRPVSSHRLEEAMADLLAIDLASKSGLGHVETMVEKFIVTASRR